MADFPRRATSLAHQVSEDFREPFILTGYRTPQPSLLHSARSAFDLHNETGSIWSHLIPSLVFVGLFADCLRRLVASHFAAGSTPVDDIIEAQFLFGAVLLFGVSAVAHTFANHSLQHRDLAFRIDYVAISYYGFVIGFAVTQFSTVMTGIYPWCDYVFIACTVVSCWISGLSRTWGEAQYAARSTVYFIFWLISNSGLLHRLFFATAAPLSGYWHAQLYFFVLVPLLNVSKFPERMWPGVFDFWGNSHQLFHITSVMGTYCQMRGFEYDRATMASLRGGLGYPRSVAFVVFWSVCVNLINITIAVVLNRRDARNGVFKKE